MYLSALVGELSERRIASAVAVRRNRACYGGGFAPHDQVPIEAAGILDVARQASVDPRCQGRATFGAGPASQNGGEASGGRIRSEPRLRCPRFGRTMGCSIEDPRMDANVAPRLGLCKDPDMDQDAPPGDETLRIAGRRELNNLLEAAMSRSYGQLRADQRLAFGQNLLKTYLLEFDDVGEHSWPEAIAAAGLTVVASRDNSVFSASRVSKKGVAVLFCEQLSARFLACHSLSTASLADAAVATLVRAPAFDSFWLSSQDLERLSGLGTLRGFSTRFQDMTLTSDDEGDGRYAREEPNSGFPLREDSPFAALNLKLTGLGAERALRRLRSAPELRSSMPLASVRVRYHADADYDFFALDDLSFNGRVTARGTSFAMHYDLLTRVTDAYADRLAEAERLQLRWTAGAMVGAPLTFNLPPDVNLPRLVDLVFSGAEPFRLLGLSNSIEGNYSSITAVDLHAGHRVDFELWPGTLRAYLRGGACANTLLRLESNLQRHLQADVVLRAEAPAA